MACCSRSGEPIEPGSRLRFFVTPPPEESSPEESFGTVFAARQRLAELPGWRLESRRVPVV